jgi:hypothetical protein
MPTYTVLKAFTDVNKAYHIAGETISDTSVVTPEMVQRGFVAYVPDATPDPDWDARMDVVEAAVVSLGSEIDTVNDRATSLEEYIDDNGLTTEA